MAPLTLAANASEQKTGHGEAAPAHKASAAKDHSPKKSRVFGSSAPKSAPAASHGQKTASASHGEPAKPTYGEAPKAVPEQKSAAAAHGEAPKPTHGDAPNAVPEQKSASAAHGEAWGYSGDTGPGQWGNLASEYGLCGSGNMQSPINVSGALPVAASRVVFNYKATGLTLRNNGHTVQADYSEGSYIVAKGRRYDLLQFHFHTPSEHLINGKKYPMEMHLVHKGTNGTLAVVGVMMEAGGENIALGEITAHLPEHKGEPANIGGVVINAGDLLPENGRYNHYKGSLTTPPCSEGVNWFVLTRPVQVSAAQINKFSGIMGENARPAQSTSNRLVISEK